MKRILLAAIVAAIFGGHVFAHEFRRAETFEDVWAGSCTVQTPNARGTGQFNGIDREENAAVITTNYHVVTNNQNVTLYFLTNGKMESVPGVVRRKAYDETAPVDVAQIYVNVDALARINPPYLPYAGRGSSPAVGDVIASSGCPRGTFPKAWRGTILNYYNGKTAVFTPAPEPGQSGSAIVSIYEDGLPYQTGVLTWLFPNSKTGGAIPIKNVYAAFEGRRPTSETGSAFPSDATLCDDPIDPLDGATQELIGDQESIESPTYDYKWFAPIVDDRVDVSFLDDNDAAWRNRKRQRPSEPKQEPETKDEKTDRSKNIIDRFSNSKSLIDRSTDEMLKRAGNEIMKSIKKAFPTIAGIVLSLAIVGGVIANFISGFLFKIFEFFKPIEEQEPEDGSKPSSKTKANGGTK